MARDTRATLGEPDERPDAEEGEGGDPRMERGDAWWGEVNEPELHESAVHSAECTPTRRGPHESEAADLRKRTTG